MHVYICRERHTQNTVVCVCVYTYMYVYAHGGRERREHLVRNIHVYIHTDREDGVGGLIRTYHVCAYIHTHTFITFIYTCACMCSVCVCIHS
jgi:hypothetical protein